MPLQVQPLRCHSQLRTILLIIELDLRAPLGIPRVLVKGPVGIMTLLLDRGPELQQLLRHGLARGFEDIDQRARLRLVVLGEEGDGEAVGACSTGPM